ncbi:MAG: DUF2760 domain-containing protein [bacterium]
MNTSGQSDLSFGRRLRIAFACFGRALTSPAFARKSALLLGATEQPVPGKAVEEPQERMHASGLFVLAMLQREGRLIDFLQEDVTSFADADIGATARVVHAGCRKALTQCLMLEPVLKDAEGDAITVPAGFDANRIRLTGNIAGQPPFRGLLKHHGWTTTAVHFPSSSDTLDPRVLAPAEVELT